MTVVFFFICEYVIKKSLEFVLRNILILQFINSLCIESLNPLPFLFIYILFVFPTIPLINHINIHNKKKYEQLQLLAISHVLIKQKQQLQFIFIHIALEIKIAPYCDMKTKFSKQNIIDPSIKSN